MGDMSINTQKHKAGWGMFLSAVFLIAIFRPMGGALSKGGGLSFVERLEK